MALPLEQGIDAESVWTALALALRERKDPAPYLAIIRRDYNVPGLQQLLDYITAIRSSRDRAAAERLLDGIDLALRGHAYSMALVLDGKRAPAEWRRGANRLLFVPERPWFNPAPPAVVTSTVRNEPGVERTPPRLY